MRKVFLDELPRWEDGGARKGKIDWKNCIGYKVKFIYDDIEGELEILNYEVKDQKLIIKYKNKNFRIRSHSLYSVSLKNILNININKFQLKIGQRLIDYNKDGSIKRDITIIDKKIIKTIDKKGKHNNKYYKYKCNICGFDCNKYYSPKENKYKDEYWILEKSLISNKHIGCSCCSNSITVKGINDMWTTNPNLASLLVNPEDGYKYTSSSSKSLVDWKCPNCGFIIHRRIDSVNSRGLSCPCCGDKISYPEKFILNILKQLLNNNYIYQLTKKKFKWINNYRYDFYFEYNNEKYIIEAHGEQHYEEGFQIINASKHIKTLKEEQENDKLKKKLALNNGIKQENYIVIDCRYSKLEFIKNNILHSKLNEIFNLSKINWLKCHEFACSSLVKQACDLWNKNIKYTTTDIGKIINVAKYTTSLYLRQGAQLGWCDYNPKHTRGVKNIKSLSKTVEIFDLNLKSLGVFPSTHELERQSEQLFGVKLRSNMISSVCNKKKKSYKGFIFKYVVTV